MDPQPPFAFGMDPSRLRLFQITVIALMILVVMLGAIAWMTFADNDYTRCLAEVEAHPLPSGVHYMEPPCWH